MNKSWFYKGSQAIQALFSNALTQYLCPLCLVSFSDDRINSLTCEHVPPKAVGGKELVLTCIDCNSEAGGKDGVDTHAKMEQNVHDFLKGKSETPLPVKLSAGDLTINAETHFNKELKILGLPENNNPALHKSFFETLYSPKKRAGYRQESFAPKS